MKELLDYLPKLHNIYCTVVDTSHNKIMKLIVKKRTYRKIKALMKE